MGPCHPGAKFPGCQPNDAKHMLPVVREENLGEVEDLIFCFRAAAGISVDPV